MSRLVGTAIECSIAWRKHSDGSGFYPDSGIVEIVNGKCSVLNCTTKCRFNLSPGETDMLTKEGSPAFVSPTLAQWGAIISEVAEKRWIACFCGHPIEAGNFDAYDHDGGLHVEGEKERQWVYHHCPKCGYDYSFQHIILR